jgi:hypothetical protein
LKKSKFGQGLSRVPIPIVPKKEEVSGWAAAVSQKPQSEAERREELERKKREILARSADGDGGDV